jgi:hypothetical protein
MQLAKMTRLDKGKILKSDLLRHAYREGGKVKHLSLVNLFNLSEEMIPVLCKWLAGSPAAEPKRSFRNDSQHTPHGHVTAVCGTLRRIGLNRVISSKPSRESQLVLALMVLRISSPGSKRAKLPSLQPETAKNMQAKSLQ